jgi:hypothetical protein
VTDPEAERYRLSSEDSRRLFVKRIVPQLLAGREPQQEPAAVILVGQPGAGKTRLSEMLARRLNERGGFADIDTDLYKPYHPDYAELMARDDRLMTLYIGPEGREWMRQAQDYVREHRINVLVHDIANDPAVSAATARSYRAAGFRVEVAALGVSQAMSDQGILNRYHEQVRERGQGRLTVPEKAAAAYTGIPQLASLIESEGLAQHVTVYRRGEDKPRYANALTDRAQPAATPVGFAQAIEAERTRPWTPGETRDFLVVQDKLRDEMSPEFSTQLDRVDALARPLLHPDVVEKRETARIARLGFPHSPAPGPGTTAQQKPRRSRNGQEHDPDTGPER